MCYGKSTFLGSTWGVHVDCTNPERHSVMPNSCKADAWKEMIGPKLTPLYVFQISMSKVYNP